ncbi:methyltransferase domain-containing protein, partial [Candidatus Parcubacteria bacterium]
MSYASGRTLVECCRGLGLRPGEARILVVGAFGGRDYFWLRGNGYEHVEILDLGHPAWGRANAVGDAAAEETWKNLKPGFDLIVLGDVLEHIPDDAQVLRLAAQATARGGHVYISVPYRHDLEETHVRAYSAGTLPRLLAATGWEVVWTVERPGPLELWPGIINSLNYAMGLALSPIGLGGRILAGALDVEFRLNNLGRPLASLWGRHMQR